MAELFGSSGGIQTTRFARPIRRIHDTGFVVAEYACQEMIPATGSMMFIIIHLIAIGSWGCRIDFVLPTIGISSMRIEIQGGLSASLSSDRLVC